MLPQSAKIRKYDFRTIMIGIQPSLVQLWQCNNSNGFYSIRQISLFDGDAGLRASPGTAAALPRPLIHQAVSIQRDRGSFRADDLCRDCRSDCDACQSRQVMHGQAQRGDAAAAASLGITGSAPISWRV
jgi:hypothetical protein